MRDPRPAFRFAKLLPGLLVLLWPEAASARVWYVDASARVSKSTDGTSWERAFRDLQDALDAAGTGDEIWVAAGTYKPSRPTNPDDPLTATFSLVDGVGLYGGFAGWEWQRGQRDPASHPTILSGDHNEDDTETVIPTSDCCIEASDAQCTDEACRAKVLAAAPFCEFFWLDTTCRSTALVLCCDLCRPSRCDNSYHVMTAANVHDVILDGLTIVHGEAKNFPDRQSAGGGVYIRNSDLSINNCVFEANRANGGAGVDAQFSELIMTNSRFVRNDLVAATVDNAKVLNCDFEQNNGALMHTGSGVIAHSRFLANGDPSDSVPALLLYEAGAVHDCTFIGNVNGTILVTGFYTITNSGILGNTGVGSVVDNSGILVMDNVIFSGNLSGSDANASLYNRGDAYVYNSVFVNNSRGIRTDYSSWLKVENSIVWDNGPPDTLNSFYEIFAELGAVGEIRFSDVQHGAGPGGHWWDLPRVGTIHAEPRFVDADGPDDISGTEDDDFHLRPDSPMIDAGDPDDDDVHRFDGDGHARIICGRVDIGAYEFGIGDYNCDHVVELVDFQGWTGCTTGPVRSALRDDCRAFDFDADSDVDLWDFAGWQQVLAAE